MSFQIFSNYTHKFFRMSLLENVCETSVASALDIVANDEPSMELPCKVYVYFFCFVVDFFYIF